MYIIQDVNIIRNKISYLITYTSSLNFVSICQLLIKKTRFSLVHPCRYVQIPNILYLIFLIFQSRGNFRVKHRRFAQAVKNMKYSLFSHQ